MPDAPDKVFLTFGRTDQSQSFSLNDRDQVAFLATYGSCDDVTGLEQCPQGTPAVFLYSAGRIEILAGS